MGGRRRAGAVRWGGAAGEGVSLASPSRAGAGSGAGGRSVGWHTAAAEAGLLAPAAGS